MHSARGGNAVHGAQCSASHGNLTETFFSAEEGALTAHPGGRAPPLSDSDPCACYSPAVQGIPESRQKRLARPQARHPSIDSIPGHRIRYSGVGMEGRQSHRPSRQIHRAVMIQPARGTFGGSFIRTLSPSSYRYSVSRIPSVLINRCGTYTKFSLLSLPASA